MDWFEGFHIHGENGSVIARVFFPYMKQVAEVVAYDSQLREYRSPTAGYTDPYERQLEAFAEAVLNDKPVVPDCVDGLLDEVVLYAIYKSIKKGNRVVVEEVGKC
jgi:predicted dehydrogenase